MKNILTTFTLSIVVLLSACKKDNPEVIDPSNPDDFVKLEMHEQLEIVLEKLNTLAGKELKLLDVREYNAQGEIERHLIPEDCEEDITVKLPNQIRWLIPAEDKFVRRNAENCLDAVNASRNELDFSVETPPYLDYKVGFQFYTNLKELPVTEKMFLRIESDSELSVEFFSTWEDDWKTGKTESRVFRRYKFLVL